MIRKLRLKLVGVAVLSLLLVFLVILTAIGVISYHKVAADADNTLTILAENNGTFPGHGGGQPPAEGGPGEDPLRLDRKMSPELPYESRYFSVLFNTDGEVVLVDTGKIAAVDTAEAKAYADQALDSGRTSGFVSAYRYIVWPQEEGTRVIFLDCGRSLSTLWSFVLIGVGVFLLGMLAVSLLIVVWSGYIVRPIADSYEKQKQFITNAGHEIKTPLTIIDADTEILLMDFGENEWLADIQNQTRRLTELTNDLILLSRLEEDQTRLQMLTFPFSDLVEETARSFQALATTQHKTFTVRVQPMVSFCGDEKMLRQLVSILLDNALKYTEPNGRIELTLRQTGRTIELSVFNTTETMARENLTHLFDRFYRTDKSRNSQTGGHGLGLSIAAAVVASHKGKITASTQDEHSLRITVILHID